MRTHLWAGLAMATALVAGPAAYGVIIYDDPDGRVAGPFDDNGSQYVGAWGVGGGVAIAPNYVLTAKHLGGGVGGTFTFGGSGYAVTEVTDIAGSDLRLLRVAGTLPRYTTLYAGDAVNDPVTIVGRGPHMQGAVVDQNGGPGANGWLWGGGAGTLNWGENRVDGRMTLGNGYRVLHFDFDAETGIQEAMYTGGDSGGGMFVFDFATGAWQVAGIGYAIDGFSTTDDDSGDFNGAIYDATGLFFRNGDAASGSQWGYASEVAYYRDAILGAMIIPEPATLALAAAAGLAVLGRRERGGVRR